MKLTFLGTGEACERQRGNSSIFLQIGRSSCLLDCGFSVVPRLLAHRNDQRIPDLLWISHLHGDHFLGVPQLLVHGYLMGRINPLTILSGTPVEETIRALMELAYPGLLGKLPFSLHFIQLERGRPTRIEGICWETEEASHSVPAFGLRVSDGQSALYYSGDGRATPETERLMEGCDLVIHEAFSLVEPVAKHDSVSSCLARAERVGCTKMALIHLAQETREAHAELTRLLAQANGKVFLANDGQTLTLPG